ncbi:hypothetical protein RM844_19705 [Streptomyces sp. DSM 44915]|uniref:Short-chain dehydrogenase n=1 Tax=Streptomyces chisholmiae TaxID=3075540 RepID=A0ABU2JU52_9ACTN|nr:hypothetical protein [Streptomyces sp. DSM 44915]MDT0268515.1 hypothetical protein [Streptomyces sp. DSM 44915]
MDGERLVLVVGGTGMLRFAVHELLDAGATVLVAGRHPERAAPGNPSAIGRLVPVQADWSEPVQLAAAVARAAGQQSVGTAVLWVHRPYGAGVHRALDGVLAPDATVVHLWGSAGADPTASRPAPPEYRPPRHYRSVVLGYVDRPDGGTRWLTDREISYGALRALADPAPRQTVGRTEPWSRHP